MVQWVESRNFGATMHRYHRLFLPSLVMASLPSLAGAQKIRPAGKPVCLAGCHLHPNGFAGRGFRKLCPEDPVNRSTISIPRKVRFWRQVYLEHTGFDKPLTIVTHNTTLPACPI